MKKHTLTEKQIIQFANHLRREERADGTIQKYLHDVNNFAAWLGERAVTKDIVLEWKGSLIAKEYAASTVNSMLAAVNVLFGFLGWTDCRIKSLRIQRRVFRDSSKELTKAEYERLVNTAMEKGRGRLALLMETICGTGIRVSEVRYITVEAAKAGSTEITLKGKIRSILLPAKLCRKLLKYAKRNNISSGEIFLTRSGRAMTRRQIWAEMKAVCKDAGVDESKVFPHNLRHLFARTFFQICRDIVKLADVLGHSSIETTRIYLISTGIEHARQMERLGLVV